MKAEKIFMTLVNLSNDYVVYGRNPEFLFLCVKIVNLKPQDFSKFELFALFETDLASSLFLK